MDIATTPDAEFPSPKHENHHRLIRVDAFYSERTASSFLRLTQHELRELLRRKGVEAVDFGKGDKFLGRDILAALELL